MTQGKPVMPKTQTTLNASPPELAIVERLIHPERGTWPAGVANAILELDFDQLDKDRMRELAAKARSGTLSAEEADLIDTYGKLGSLLAILQSKARQSLKNCTFRDSLIITYERPLLSVTVPAG
jgi:hypothetical protein